MDTALTEGLANGPAWVRLWVGWMILVNSLSVVFIPWKKEARVVLVVWAFTAISMTVLSEMNGYNRLLGLTHVVWWSPLLYYIYRRRHEIEPMSLYARWLATLFVTNACSLVLDYIDLVRYVLGDRS